MLEQYKREIENKDSTIDALKRLIGDKELINKELAKNKKLTQTKQSFDTSKMKSSNKNVKIEILVPKNENPIPKKSEKVENMSDLGSKLIMLEDELADIKVKSKLEIDEKNEKILELIKQLEDLKIDNKGKEEKIKRTEELLEKFKEELKDRERIKTDLDFAKTKCEAYEKEIERLLNRSNIEVSNIPSLNIDQEQMNIENIGLLQQLNQYKSELEDVKNHYSEQIKMYNKENERLNSRISELQNEISKAVEEKKQGLIVISDLKNKLTNHEGTYEEYKRSIKDSSKDMINQVNSLKEDKISINAKYINAVIQIDELQTELQEKDTEIDIYQARLSELNKELQLLKANIKKSEINAVTEILGGNTKTLKKKVKELSQKEVELIERLDEERNANKSFNETFKSNYLLNLEQKNKYKSMYDKTMMKLSKYQN